MGDRRAPEEEKENKMNTAQIQPIATLYDNGTIRNAEGTLIGFYNRENDTLHVSGLQGAFRVTNDEWALDTLAIVMNQMNSAA